MTNTKPTTPLTRNDVLEEAAKQAEYERDRWQSSRDPLPDDVEGGRTASTNIAAAIRALKTATTAMVDNTAMLTKP